MKKLILTISLLLLSFSAFADIFSLYSWNTPKDDVINSFINNGWTFEIDKGTGDFTFYVPNDNIYYNGEEVKNVRYHFIDNNIYSQSITFAYAYPEDKVFSIALHMIAKDKAKIISENRSFDDLYKYLYRAELDNCSSFYLIMGKNNKMLLAVGYEKNR